MATCTFGFKRIFPLLLLLLLFGTAHAQLNGTYTIGGAIPDYATITDAVADLNSLGTSAPVTFQIRAGTYNEQVTITSFARTGNPDDTVIFTRASPAVTVTWDNPIAGLASNWVVKLDGADYVIFQGISFQSTAPSPNNRIFVLENGADHNTIRNGSLTGELGATTNAGSLVYSDGTQDQFNTFENNTFVRGYRGIDMQSIGTAAADRAEGNTVTGNTFSGQTEHGIFLRRQQVVLIDGNMLNDAAWSNTTWTGIETDGKSTEITNNTIDSQIGSKGIRLMSTTTTADDRLIANNMVNMRSVNTDAGIVVATGEVEVYHNTVRVGGAGQLLTPIRVNSGTLFDIGIKNNLFVNDGGGYAMRAPVGTNVTSSDYNNFYTAGSFLIEWDGLPEADLPAHQATSGLDANSVELAVTFVDIVGTGDLHLSGSSDGDARLAGVDGLNVAEDIDAETRDPFNPYMGADEATSIAPLDNADTASGFYTVGGATPDFDTPSRAITHLNYRGIKGEVSFRIRAGTYGVNKIIEAFSRYGNPLGGTSPTVEFRAANQTTPPTLRHAAVAPADNWVIKLDGADGVLFRKIDFVADGAGQWGHIIVLENSADDNTFEACSFTGLTGQTDISATLIFNDVGDAGDRTHLLNNTFDQGAYGTYLNGVGSTGTIIEANTFTDFENAGIFAAHDDLTVIDNVLNGHPTSGTTGMYLGPLNDMQVLRNQVVMPHTGTRGITFFGADGVASPGLVANNFITAPIGIRVATGSSNIQFYHNSVYSTDTSAFQVLSTSDGGHVLRNNILYNQGSPLLYALEVDEAADIASSDYNILYNGSGTDHVVNWDGTDYFTLDGFQNATGLEPHSAADALTFVDPLNGDLHIDLASATNPALGGVPVPEVTDDIDGEARGLFPVPYIGADERLDVGPLGILVDASVYLSGAFDSGTGLMRTDLNSTGILEAEALSNPYSGAPWNCGAAFSVAAGFFTSNPTIVDWVCVRLLTGDPLSPPMTEVASDIGFIDDDGQIYRSSFSGDEVFFPIIKDDYYVVVEHRNHLAVMSADPVNFSSGTGFWDGRLNLAETYTGGGTAVQDLGGSRFGLWGGDGDANGSVTAFDFLNEWLPINGAPPGYDAGDFDMNGSGTAFDFLTTWLPANGQASQVP